MKIKFKMMTRRATSSAGISTKKKAGCSPADVLPLGQNGRMKKRLKIRKHSMECGNVLYSYECRMMAWVMIGILFLGKRMEVRAQELSANPFGLESTANPFSEAGSPFGRESINNPFSEVGSPFSVRGVDNPFGTGVKLDTSDPLDRELGLDKDPLSWESLTEAAAQKTKELAEESAKESAQWDLERAARKKDNP